MHVQARKVSCHVYVFLEYRFCLFLPFFSWILELFRQFVIIILELFREFGIINLELFRQFGIIIYFHFIEIVQIDSYFNMNTSLFLDDTK
jgi:hypothetical protein